MSTDSTKKLDDIIQQYSDKSDYIKEKLNDPNSSDIQDNLKKLVERVEQCKTLKNDYNTKHEQIQQLNEWFTKLSQAIKHKITVDSQLMEELVKMFSNWATDDKFVEEYSIPKEEMSKLVAEQETVLSELRQSIEELNKSDMSLANIEEYSIEQLQEIINKMDNGDYSSIIGSDEGSKSQI